MKKNSFEMQLIDLRFDSQEQYQMAFIKCQYTDDYLLTKSKRCKVVVKNL